jgi:hypothetical protein
MTVASCQESQAARDKLLEREQHDRPRVGEPRSSRSHPSSGLGAHASLNNMTVTTSSAITGPFFA